MKLFTIGFTQTTAQSFFQRLRDAQVRTVWDTRLHPDGQLSGFAKRQDLGYFLRELSNSEYEHIPDLAPTDDILKAYKRRVLSWAEYEREYRALLRQRLVMQRLQLPPNACFLCSEHSPERCHRRVAAEFFQESFSEHPIEIVHL